MEVDIDALKEKRLCYKCTDEKVLRNLIETEGKSTKKCSYCGEKNNSLSVGIIAKLVEEAFKRYYVLTSEIEYPMPGHGDRNGDPVIDAIAMAAQIENEPAEDIQQILDDDNYDLEKAKMSEEWDFHSESYYEFKGANDWYWQSEWRAFEMTLKTKSRYYNAAAGDFLQSIFHEVHSLKSFRGNNIIVEAGPGTEIEALYRARAFQSNKKLAEALERPDKHIGPPPSELSRAGRMNAKGISVFYGSNDEEVAVSEVRPPVGSRVAVAKFKILKPIKLLDLDALAEAYPDGSVFEERYERDLAKAAFLRFLSKKITQPVMPDDEDFEYLPTQVIADYLANSDKPNIDGIKFKSAQFKKEDIFNVVLFHKASFVEPIIVEEDIEMEVDMPYDLENEHGTMYSVRSVIPVKRKTKTKKRPPFWSFEEGLLEAEWDEREPTLQVDLDEINVHHIDSVRYENKPNKVYRHMIHEKDLLSDETLPLFRDEKDE